MANRKSYRELSNQDKSKMDAFLKEIRLLNDLMLDAAPPIKDELAAERHALVDQINRILAPSPEITEINQEFK